MPIIQITYGEGALRPKQKAELAGKLNEVLLEMEGGARTEAGRAFAWVMFHELREDDWWIDGRTDDAMVSPPGKFLVHVTIPEGYMNAMHKSDVHRAVNDAIVAVMGSGDQANAGNSILIVIDEVTEGNWGAGGRTIGMATISKSVGLPQEGERYRWVCEYFSAKSRALAAAGYPADLGGVLGSTPKR